MSEKINNGGTAFPVTEQHGANFGECGMTLRQYLAAHAPFTLSDVRNEWVNDSARSLDHNYTPTTAQLIDRLAAMRTEYADAMLKAMEAA